MNRLDRYNRVAAQIMAVLFGILMVAMYVAPPILFIVGDAPWWVWPLYALMYLPPLDIWIRHRLRIKDEADRDA